MNKMEYSVILLVCFILVCFLKLHQRIPVTTFKKYGQSSAAQLIKNKYENKMINHKRCRWVNLGLRNEGNCQVVICIKIT